MRSMLVPTLLATTRCRSHPRPSSHTSKDAAITCSGCESFEQRYPDSPHAPACPRHRNAIREHKTITQLAAPLSKIECRCRDSCRSQRQRTGREALTRAEAGSLTKKVSCASRAGWDCAGSGRHHGTPTGITLAKERGTSSAEHIADQYEDSCSCGNFPFDEPGGGGWERSPRVPRNRGVSRARLG